MKNFEFKPLNKIVLTQSAVTPTKTRVLEPNFEAVCLGLQHKQNTDFPLQSFDNLFVIGKIELTIASEVQGIVSRYSPVYNEKNELVGITPNWKKCYKIIPTVQEINGVEKAGYKFRLMNPTEKQRIAIEKCTDLAPVTEKMLG